jgi:hypothetical protein
MVARPFRRGHPAGARAQRQRPADRQSHPVGGAGHGHLVHRLPHPGRPRRARVVPRARWRGPIHREAPPLPP